MVEKLFEMDLEDTVSKMDLMAVLKSEARSIHIQEIMNASNFIREDAKYMPPKEREDFIERFTRAFIIRIKDIKEDKNRYTGNINVGKLEKLREFIKIQKNQFKRAENDYEASFYHIASIVSTYAAFIREESIHPLGTRFPGGFKLRYQDGKYLCPVKDKQKDTPGALCRFCVSVQDDSV